MRKKEKRVAEDIQHAMNSLRIGLLRSPEYEDSMQRLWIAVILQAMLDLMAPSDKIRKDAEEFFAGETLEYICDHTGLSYVDVLNRATELVRGHYE
jgi:hypothetical protein